MRMIEGGRGRAGGGWAAADVDEEKHTVLMI